MESQLIHLASGKIVCGYSSHYFRNSLIKPAASLSAILLLTAMFLGNLILYPLAHSIALIVVATILSVVAVTTFLMTLLKDPGILPKQVGRVKLSQYFSTDLLILRIPKNRQLSQNLMMMGQANRLIDIKLCPECILYRSAETAHCSQCDVCVLGHDHHCGWMGKCIGRHNYGYFFIFLTAVVMMLGFYLAIMLAQLIDSIGQVGATAWTSVNIAQEAVAFIYLCQLWIFHIRLVLLGKTTRQLLKDRDTRHKKEGCANFKDICNSYEGYYRPDRLVVAVNTSTVSQQLWQNASGVGKVAEEYVEEGEPDRYTGQEEEELELPSPIKVVIGQALNTQLAL